MTMWDFLHLHAEGTGGLLGLVVFLLFLAWFIKEINK